MADEDMKCDTPSLFCLFIDFACNDRLGADSLLEAGKTAKRLNLNRRR